MSSAQPFLSIITITKNNLIGLENTHQSIEIQTNKNYEWVVIDGASTDNSIKFAQKHAHITINEQDNGIYDAMNKGVRLANSMYTLFLNAGDQLSSPKTLETIKNTVKSGTKNPDFIYGDALEAHNNQKPHYKSAKPHKNLEKGMFTHHQSMIYNTEHLKNFQYNLSYKIAADYDLTCRFLQNTDDILYIPEPLCLFESGGISQIQTKQGRLEQFQIRRELNLCSPIKNRQIYTKQLFATALRKQSPKLYWWLRSLRNSH